MQFTEKYSAALEPLIGRKPEKSDGIEAARLTISELRLKLKLPLALKEYYILAGSLTLNTEHNRLFSPEKLTVENEKLVFMEENQKVVFWGMDILELGIPDPTVFQANNEESLTWQPEAMSFSDFIIKMWRWQRGLDTGL